MTLQSFFQNHPNVALAFSGGVDSAYLLHAAVRSGARVGVYYVKSAFQPQFELEDAQRFVRELNIALRVIPLDILSEDVVTANPPDRCYYCKRRILSAVAEAAREDGFSLLIDGTNASDDASSRPGMKVLEELGIRSPLRECGLTKEQIRQLSKEAGLFTWDKPAYACLATRIPTGEIITKERLQITEAAEDCLFSMGFSDIRVRWMTGNCGKIQMTEEQLPRLLSKRNEILAKLKPYYSSVLLDLEVRGEQ